MTTKNLRIFISSTWQDLREERDVVRESIARMGLSFIGMEYFGSNPQAPLKVCLEKVEQSDLFVLIVAHKYGARVKKDSISFLATRQFDVIGRYKAEQR